MNGFRGALRSSDALGGAGGEAFGPAPAIEATRPGLNLEGRRLRRKPRPRNR